MTPYSTEWLEGIQLYCVFVWAVAQTMFVILYGTQPWFRHYFGRAMFFKSLALMSLLDAEVSAFLWPYRYSEYTKTVVIVLGMIGSIWQLYAWVRNKTNAQVREARHVQSGY